MKTKVYGIGVVTNDIFIAPRDKSITPPQWASKEDQEFYLLEYMRDKPLTIMGSGTYDEVLNSKAKTSVYKNIGCVILDPSATYTSSIASAIRKDNSQHAMISINSLEQAGALIVNAAQYFDNYQISIAGGGSVYSLFLPFYDKFFLTVETDLVFTEGYKLFDVPVIGSEFCYDIRNATQGNVDDILIIMRDNGLFLHGRRCLSSKTLLYEFWRSDGCK